MDALLILLAVPAGLWALARIGASAWGVARANHARTHELQSAAKAAAGGRGVPRVPLETIRCADLAAANAAEEDYSLTGAILAGLGALAMFGGRALAYGDWAVGLYSAGTLAIVSGFGLAVFGAVLRVMAKPLLDSSDQDRNS